MIEKKIDYKENASLVVVGTGIKFLSHLTKEVIAYIKQSDKVLYLVNDPAMKEWILCNHSNAESLESLYSKYVLRKDNYHAITNYILDFLRKIQHVCVVLYVHPGVLADPGLAAVKVAKLEGFYAKVLPGISSEDCLFSDFLIDPGSQGCHSFEATDFLLYKRKFDPRGHLILWQVDVIGILTNPVHNKNKKGLRFLLKYLNEFYPFNHEIILYEAAQYPLIEPNIKKMFLHDLLNTHISRISTLYIPPLTNSGYDEEFIRDMGININDL